MFSLNIRIHGDIIKLSNSTSFIFISFPPIYCMPQYVRGIEITTTVRPYLKSHFLALTQTAKPSWTTNNLYRFTFGKCSFLHHKKNFCKPCFCSTIEKNGTTYFVIHIVHHKLKSVSEHFLPGRKHRIAVRALPDIRILRISVSWQVTCITINRTENKSSRPCLRNSFKSKLRFNLSHIIYQRSSVSFEMPSFL